MSRALVLGGGGPVGIGWEAGLVLGLQRGGVNLAEADSILGTSAGAAVGAELALGKDLALSAGHVAAAIGRQSSADAEGTGGAAGADALMAAMAIAVQWEGPQEEARQQLGRVALESVTISEDEFIGLFAEFAGEPWPDRFSCTTVDAVSGRLVVWDKVAGIDLQRGVASSCSVPGVYPAVSIGGRRYMDGGMRSALNADLAVGHEVVVVISVTALALPAGMTDPFFDRVLVRMHDEFDVLRAGGSDLGVIEPDEEFLAISEWGLGLMDASRAAAALDAGLRQGQAEAERLRSLWTV